MGRKGTMYMKEVYEELEKRIIGRNVDEALALIKPCRTFRGIGMFDGRNDAIFAIVAGVDCVWFYHLMCQGNRVLAAQVIAIPYLLILSWLFGSSSDS